MYGQNIDNFMPGWCQCVLFLITCSNFIFLRYQRMELFNTGVLKKEYKEFANKTWPDVLPCSYCNIECCKWHSRFLVACKQCHEQRCNNCKIFNLHMSFLMQNAYDIGKNYIFIFFKR